MLHMPSRRTDALDEGNSNPVAPGGHIDCRVRVGLSTVKSQLGEDDKIQFSVHDAAPWMPPVKLAWTTRKSSTLMCVNWHTLE